MNKKPIGQKALYFILITVLLDAIGFGIIIPVMPDLLVELLDIDTTAASTWGGYLSFCYAAMHFLFGPLIGSLSDRFGRRPVLLLSLAALTIDYLILAFAQTITVLFVGRILTGICGASFATANAYIADVSDEKNRGKAFGMVGAAFGVGFILGPVIGGFLGSIDDRAPFFASAGLALVNMCPMQNWRKPVVRCSTRSSEMWNCVCVQCLTASTLRFDAFLPVYAVQYGLDV